MGIRGSFLIALSFCGAAAWDGPLPVPPAPATGVSQGAFANPAAGFGTDVRTRAAFARWDVDGGGRRRLWALEREGDGWAAGFRFWEGASPYLARFDYALAWNGSRFITAGLRPAYVWDGAGSDHLLLDAGLDLRLLPQLMVGAWTENLASGGPEPRVHRLAAAARPLAGFGGDWRDLSFGYGIEKEEDAGRNGFLFAQVPLLAGLRAEGAWDPGRRQGSVGVTLQLTGRFALGLGASRGGTPAGMRNRLASGLERDGRAAFAAEWRTALKTPFLASEGAVALVDLNREIVEGESRDGWFGGGGTGFLPILRRFDALDADDRLRAAVFKLGEAECGWSMGEEIRGRIARLRARGVRTVAYMEQVTPLNYHIAAACETIAMQPEGHFAVNGFAAEVMFYRGLLDKLGVRPQFLRHGEYKSFEEPFTRKEMSEPMRTDLEGFLGSLWDNFLSESARARGMSKDSLRRALEAPDIGLDHALRAGLIDTVAYADQLAELAGGKCARLSGGGAPDVAKTPWDIPPRIAVVVVTGNMVLGGGGGSWLAGPDLAGSEPVAAQLRRARRDPSVKAVVLRVDSPGGSAQAADVMRREVELLKKDGKPVVASVGRDAASGGYYLICGADRIVAEPNSVVGSIGVLWGKFVLDGLYAKLGLNVETVKTSPHADANSSSRPLDSLELEAVQRHMDEFYAGFVAKVAAGRNLSRAKVDSLGRGRIFTGSQAAANGLVDGIGGLEDAIDSARNLAGIGARRAVEIAVFSTRQDADIPFAGSDWIRGRTDAGLLPALRREADRLSALTEPGLWAVAPELAGWGPLEGMRRE